MTARPVGGRWAYNYIYPTSTSDTNTAEEIEFPVVHPRLAVRIRQMQLYSEGDTLMR